MASKKVFVLNIPSELELFYIHDGIRISKKKFEELKKEHGNKLKVVIKDLHNMRVYNSENRSIRSNSIAFDDEVSDNDSEVADLYFSL